MVSTRSRRGVPLPAPMRNRRTQRNRNGDEHVNGERIERRVRRYGPNDTTNRHRLQDGQPKSVSVVPHTRRKP